MAALPHDTYYFTFQGLLAPNPAGYSLDMKEAYRFLTESAVELSQAGFGILLPSWWTQKGTKTHLKAQVKVKGKKLQAGNGLTLYEIPCHSIRKLSGVSFLKILERKKPIPCSSYLSGCSSYSKKAWKILLLARRRRFA